MPASIIQAILLLYMGILVQCAMLQISITVKRNHEGLIYVDRDDKQKQLYKKLTVMGK